MSRPIALDLFAGTGWGVACQKLGIEEYGVEIMPEAIATRDAAGMTTIFRDVWDGIEGRVEGNALDYLNTYEILVASPPCQTFSVAGKGAGRAALDDVLGVIRFGGYKSAEQLRALTAHLDDRTALVLTPLVYAYRDRPMHIVLEQVPTVLPVWEACAEVLREIGYSAVTGVLNAEQYGVPQTRKRAILIARRDGEEAEMPTPTHSRYYSRSPEKLDAGVHKWVSMAEALGWGSRALVQERHRGSGMLKRHGERPARPVDHPALTVTGNASGTTPGGFRVAESLGWPYERPARTIVARDILPGPKMSSHDARRGAPGSVKLEDHQAAALQSYPSGFPFQGAKGKRFLQIGNAVPPLLGEAILAPIYEAMTSTIDKKEAA